MKNKNHYLKEGNLLFKEKKFHEALKCYEKAVQADPDNPKAWYNQGLALKYLKRSEEAIAAYTQAIELNPDYSIAWSNKGFVFIQLERFEEAAACFAKADKDILDIIVYTNRVTGGKIATIMLEKDPFFQDTLAQQKTALSSKQKELYKRIYIRSLQIIKRLHITSDEENEVAHYTKKTVSHQLVVDQSNFRLNSITNSNDPKEGKTLLDYLFPNEITFQEDNRAFVGCFVFNPDFLNQFRLYGKENGQEATGVSIIVNHNFFSKDIKRSTLSTLSEKDKMNKDKDEMNKHALFRCIYIDPDTDFVVSVGHKEEYIFRREDYKGIDFDKNITDYKENTEKILNSVRKQLDSLKRYINRHKKGMDLEIVGKLLINLRYLTKHVAFKEEQECRIVRILPVTGKENGIKTAPGQMYIDYLPMTNYVQKIYLGPKATGLDLYQDIIKLKGLERIKCYQCKLPFSG